MQKFIEQPLEQYIQEIAELGKTKTKVFFSTQKNAPIKVGRYDLFLKNGEKFSFSGWNQFIESIYFVNYQGKEVNFQKTWDSFKNSHPENADRVIIVEYLESDEHKDKVFTLERVYEKQKNKKLPAKEFKDWVGEYMSQFSEIPYEHDEYASVKKIVEHIEDAVNASKESSI